MPASQISQAALEVAKLPEPYVFRSGRMANLDTLQHPDAWPDRTGITKQQDNGTAGTGLLLPTVPQFSQSRGHSPRKPSAELARPGAVGGNPMRFQQHGLGEEELLVKYVPDADVFLRGGDEYTLWQASSIIGRPAPAPGTLPVRRSNTQVDRMATEYSSASALCLSTLFAPGTWPTSNAWSTLSGITPTVYGVVPQPTATDEMRPQKQCRCPGHPS